MKWTIVAGFACGLALLLGACSSNNASGTTTGGSAGSGTGSGNGAGSGSEGANQGTAAQQEALTAADTAHTNAMARVAAAQRAAERAAREETPEARAAATRAIRQARDALDDSVDIADKAVKATEDAPAEVYGSAIKKHTRADNYKTAEDMTLNGLLTTFGWYRTKFVRYTIAASEVDEPSDGVNTANIVRTPRTVDTSATDDTQIVNNIEAEKDNLINANEFPTLEYEAGKQVFSGNADEFRVDGYVAHADASLNFDQGLQTGLKITPTGIEIRTGGVRSRTSNLGAFETDYLDMRQKINVDLGDGTAGAANAWDLKIIFDEPDDKTTTPSGDKTNWFGNGDYYWRAVVDPHEDQLDRTKTDFYVADTFEQDAGNKDLGTYEVWLSNHVDLNKRLEPDADAGVIRCPGGGLSSETDNSCPDDDQNYYLDYAAYGLFVYTADLAALGSASVTTGDVNSQTVRGSRIQSMYFGYSAFADSDDKRTKDIGKAIERGTFRGRTIARAFTGTATVSPENAVNRFLRGDVSLEVNIAKGDTGTTNIKGELSNFEEWNRAGGVWVKYPSGFKVYMNADGTPTGAAVDIEDDGTFDGVSKFAQTNIGTVPTVGSLPVFDPTATSGSGAIFGGGSGAGGVFEGSFYGDRSTSANLEAAGSWGMGPRTVDSATPNTGNLYNIIGSFGAKQRPAPPAAAAPAEN